MSRMRPRPGCFAVQAMPPTGAPSLAFSGWKDAPSGGCQAKRGLSTRVRAASAVEIAPVDEADREVDVSGWRRTSRDAADVGPDQRGPDEGGAAVDDRDLTAAGRDGGRGGGGRSGPSIASCAAIGVDGDALAAFHGVDRPAGRRRGCRRGRCRNSRASGRRRCRRSSRSRPTSSARRMPLLSRSTAPVARRSR